MNLRRILQGLALCLFVVFYSNNVQAQAQLAAVNQDGLIQLGANHPFVVGEYEIDLTPLNVTTTSGAIAALKPYIDEGFTFTYDMASKKATLTIDVTRFADTQSIPVAEFNKARRGIHRIRG